MKRLAIALAAMLLTVAASAQQFGLIGGISSANSLKNLDVKNVDEYHFGVAINLPVNSVLRFQPEFLYNVKGTALGDGIKDFDADLSVGYIEAGLQGQLGLDLDVFRVYGLAEPFLGYAIKDKSPSGDLSDYLNKVEYGLALGAGVELFDHIQFAAKYYWNAGKMLNSDSKLSVKDDNFNGVMLTVGIFF